MKRILVIEDDLENRENIAEILELAGYEVMSAENGKMGAALAIMHHPDLIVCDVLMPEMNGYELLSFLHHEEGFSDLKFIFLTALAEPKDLIKGFELGADDYVTKPFTDDELLEAVQNRLLKQIK